MPELPEVETIRAGLEERITGRRVVEVELLWAGCVATPTADELVTELPGRRIERTGRRGKFLVLDLDGGAALTVHLRMTGRLRISAEGEERRKHLRAVITFDSGEGLWFEDQRKFGRLYFTRDASELATVLSKLGPEPLEAAFTREALAKLLAGRRAQLKPLLLNQSFIAGLGNIYVDEALFRARLHPQRRTDTLAGGETAALHEAIVHALRQGIANRGTTLSDYRDATGASGLNRERLSVFRRDGTPCLRCGAPIEKIRVAQRGTHICSACQSPPPTT
ncbi:MAG: bifunctional DNA-formamidopyrimidine glycosylase/DNA-(apurinic or apyrimidinic site) lyase [Chloroflexota bacterium]